MAQPLCIIGTLTAALLLSLHGSVTAADYDLSPARQFVAAETGEVMQGGATTHFNKADRNAFSHPAANMEFDHQLNFQLGNSIFRKLWVSSPSSTTASDGLGPLYNARSCERCHQQDGRGHTPQNNWPEDNAISMFLRLSIPPQTTEQEIQLKNNRIGVVPEPTYGGQLQDFAVTGMPAEGRMQISYTDLPVNFTDGSTVVLRKPEYTITDTQYGPLHPDTMLSPRIAPPMIGLGLLEAISEQDLLTLADPDDSDGDGISGRTNRVWDSSKQTVVTGRFGWKAGNPTLHQQNNGAFNGDIGISTPTRSDPYGDCTSQQSRCLQQPNGDTPAQGNREASAQMLDLVLFYTRNLAVPARRNASQPEVLAGKKLFYQSGCVGCHQPKFVTTKHTDIPEQSEQLIWPYSDLLLHDMGEGLADNRPEFAASGSEWRTPPLWGIGLTKAVNGHTQFLHDGRARNLMEAILWHGGEAEPARQQVIKMSKMDRTNLIQFLESL
ncbi:di-heme oxidoredictase family protein [Amphritea sp. HPY]|uniref:di-heme oxidoreductase family protein n=1 Tax=Amphritea sp. HPY TaxID=3421652 RepID=UPI003D7EB411